jgi:hypothetical protein
VTGPFDFGAGTPTGRFEALITFACTEPGEAGLTARADVILAFPDRGDEFWEGVAVSARTVCESPLTLTAGFNDPQLPGTAIDLDGQTCSSSEPASCRKEFYEDPPKTVTLVADPGPHQFVSWSGEGCTGSEPVIQVTFESREPIDCIVTFAPSAPSGPALMIYDDVQLAFNGDHFDLAPGNTRALVSPMTGIGLFEVNLDDTYDIFVSDDHPNMCPGAPIVADEPAIGRVVMVFGTQTTSGCLTQYPPLDFAVGLFGVGSSTGDVATFNGLGQYARTAFNIGQVQIQVMGAAGSTNVQLTPGETSCPRYLAIVGTTAFVTTEEGTPGTATEACAATVGLYRVDLAGGTVTGSLRTGSRLRGLTVTGDGATAYVSDYGAGVIHVFDAQTLQPVRTIPLPGVVDVALSGDGALLIGARYDADELALVDLATDQVVSSVPTRGARPTRFRYLGNDRFALLDFGDPGSGIPSRFETVGIIRP